MNSKVKLHLNAKDAKGCYIIAAVVTFIISLMTPEEGEVNCLEPSQMSEYLPQVLKACARKRNLV